MKLEIRKIGHSTGILLQNDLLAVLGLAEGKAAFAYVLPDRTMTLSRSDPYHDKVTEIGWAIYRDYHKTFKAIAT